MHTSKYHTKNKTKQNKTKTKTKQNKTNKTKKQPKKSLQNNIRTEAHLRRLRRNHVLPWFTPEGLTDETQVVDSHTVLSQCFVKKKFVCRCSLKEDYYRVQEEWLEDPENLRKWEEQSFGRKTYLDYTLACGGCRTFSQAKNLCRQLGSHRVWGVH